MDSFKRNIIITGGAGFIGSHVVRLFVNKYPEYRIINLDKLTYNCGLKYSFWKDYINAVVEMTECKHLSGGVIFKVHLK